MKKEECRRVLDESSTFSQLGSELTDIVFDAMTLEHHPPGFHLIRQGDPGERLLVMIKGHAVARLQDNGMGHDLGEFFPGDVFGEIALLTKEARSADVVLDQDAWVLSLDVAEFDKLAMMHPEVAVVLTHLTADRLGRDEHDGLGGKSVGGYRIRRCIGRGAMAVVYEAESDRDHQRCALKMMSHRLIYETTALQRFQREGELLLKLQHPHIAVVHDRFRAYRTYFLAMEYCGGGSLEASMRAHSPFPLEQVRGIAGQLALALGYLHGQGVLHRDVKPANILFDEAGNLKLADFGLARPGVSMGDGLTTDSAVVVGTPLYLAPELFSGTKPGPASDLYSLGCILFELLHGQLPFDATDLGHMIESKRRGAPKFDAHLDDVMKSMLSALLSPKPARRAVDLHVLESWAAPIDSTLLVRV